MNFISFVKKLLRKIGAILPGNPCYQCNLIQRELLTKMVYLMLVQSNSILIVGVYLRLNVDESASLSFESVVTPLEVVIKFIYPIFLPGWQIKLTVISQ